MYVRSESGLRIERSPGNTKEEREREGEIQRERERIGDIRVIFDSYLPRQ